MGTLKVRVGDAWEVIGAGSSEVLVSDVDPYVLDPAATEELWYSPVVKQLFARVNGEWRIATPNEVAVSRADPALLDPEVELWYDVDASPGNGAPKPPAIDEVWVGDTEPIKPTIELWYDTVAPGMLKARVNGAWVPVTMPPELPLGGLGGEPLVKNSSADQDVRWGGDLSTGSIFPASGKVIQYPNVTGPKINLYSTTFGLGVESGETSIFASSKVGFHANASNGALWAEINANGLGPRTNTNVSWQNGFSGSAQFRVNPAVVTLALWEFTNGVDLYAFNPVKMFDYPAGVPAPWMNCSGAVMPVWMGGSLGYLPLRVDCRTDGVFMYAADYFTPGDLWECACTVTWAR